MLFVDHLLIAVFEFSSLPMLGWLAAAALPWLIHRLFRQRHRTTQWAAVELLLGAMRQRARRIQLQQWLLLAVRTAILLLVVLAAAEPAMRQWAVGADSRTAVHRILVVDQSYSMGCRQEETTRWQLAQNEVRNWIDSSNGDVLTLIGWNRQAENLLGRPTFDTSIARTAFDSLKLSQSSADLSVAVRGVLAAIERAKQELPDITTQHVVFCTDLGRNTWEVDAATRDLLEQLGQQARVTVVNVASQTCDNLAITDLRIEPAITLQQREATISATVTSFGNLTSGSATVELLVDGRSIEQRQLTLQQNGQANAAFTHRFVDARAHTVQVVLAENDDCLPVDDQRWLVTKVRPRLKVAVFAGEPHAVDDLARALAPGDAHGVADSPNAPEVLSVTRLGEVALSEYAAVLLGSVSELSPREAATLTEYVRQGGALAMFLGQVGTNNALSELQQLLPVELLGLQEPGDYRFDPMNYQHPIVGPFRGQTQAGLVGVTISQYQRMKVLPQETEPEIALAFNTGDPALVIGHLGLGRVGVFALPGSLAARTPAEVPWSSFALSPSYLPVVRELVTYLVGNRWLEQRNLQVGDVAIVPWPRVANAAEVRLPDGVQRALAVPAAEDMGQLPYHKTDAMGVYRFSADGRECARFAVNLDGRDSDLSAIAIEDLPEGLVTDVIDESIVATNATRNFSFVRTLLSAALMLMLLEVGLAWWLGRGWR